MNMTPEDYEQAAYFTWAEIKLPANISQFIFHVPNGGKRDIATAKKFKSLGVRKGVPDIFLDYPVLHYHGLRIELKKPKMLHQRAGRMTKEQKAWLDHYNALGYKAVVAHGWVEAAKITTDYLKGNHESK